MRHWFLSWHNSCRSVPADGLDCCSSKKKKKKRRAGKDEKSRKKKGKREKKAKEEFDFGWFLATFIGRDTCSSFHMLLGRLLNVKPNALQIFCCSSCLLVSFFSAQYSWTFKFILLEVNIMCNA